MPITTFTASTTAVAEEVNDNFALCVLTDTIRTVTVSHVYTASQTLTGGWTAAAACTITAASASALTVGRQGATDPVLKVHSSTASQATGISITGKAAASGAAIAVISSGTNEALTIDAKGSGTVTIGATSTGNVVLGDSMTITSAGAVSGITTLAGTGAISGFTTIAMTGKISTTVTTEQLRLNYDSLNYMAVTVASDGTTTFDSVDDGSTGAFVFDDAVAMNTTLSVIGVMGVNGAGTSSTTALLSTASTTGVSPLRIPHGDAPTSPVNGDIWTTTAGLYVRINGATVGPLTA